MSGQPGSYCCFCEEQRNVETPLPYQDTLLLRRCPEDQVTQSRLLYESLSVGEIRLLELQPSSGQAPLVGHLITTTIQEDIPGSSSRASPSPAFEAISYCWGVSRNPEYELRCNDIVYPISLETYRALHRLRHSREPRRIWIDAICINQHDEREQSRQFAQMFSIYQSAHKVAIYLGEIESDGARFLLEILEDYVKANEGSLNGTPARDRIDCIHYDQVGDFCEHHATLILQGLEEIASLRWFTRVWIKQEFWVAQSLEVHFGNARFPWKVMDVSRFILTDLQKHMPPQHFETAQTLSIALRKKVGSLTSSTSDERAAVMQKGASNPFLDPDADTDIISVMIMNQSHAAECTNPQGHVYALLGMTNTSVSSPGQQIHPCAFTIDYSEPAADTFRRLAEHIILRDNSLFLLFVTGCFPRPAGSGVVEGVRLPSWVPDWRNSLGMVLRPRDTARAHLRRAMGTAYLRIDKSVLSTTCRKLGRLNSQGQVDFDDVASKSLLQHLHPDMILPSGARVADNLVLLEHTHVPVVLRPDSSHTGIYSYVGPMNRPGWLLGSYDIPDDFEVKLARITPFRIEIR